MRVHLYIKPEDVRRYNKGREVIAYVKEPETSKVVIHIDVPSNEVVEILGDVCTIMKRGF